MSPSSCWRRGCVLVNDKGHLLRVRILGSSCECVIDTRVEDNDTLVMVTKTKRTYNLSPTTVDHVRELAEHSRVARSQDGVVEIAVERFYLEVRAREEAALWEAAANDPSFMAEMTGIARDFRDSEVWPA
jgi:hypothetical protein